MTLLKDAYQSLVGLITGQSAAHDASLIPAPRAVSIPSGLPFARAGLYYYKARWYDSSLGRFLQADTIIPNPGSVVAWDRYAYAGNNPVKYNDPSGHDVGCPASNPVCSASSGDSSSNHAVRYAREQQQVEDEINDIIQNPVANSPGLSNTSCPTNTTCIFPSEQISYRDNNPYKPDYYVLSGSLGEGAGITVTITYDRYGNVYIAGGGNVGKSLAAGAVSLNGGWIGSATDNEIPDQGTISQFFTGFSANGSVGAVGDVAATWSPGAGDNLSHTSFEYGGLIPASAGVSITYGIQIYPWQWR